MRKYLTTIVLAIVIAPLLGQDYNKAKMDSVLDVLSDHDKFMGSLAVTQNGVVLYARAIGFRDRSEKLKPDSNTKFRVGSISKTFTAVMIFKAIEAGKISLEQTINQYFTGIKNEEVITISNLLNHRSGIYSFTSQPDYLEWSTSPKSREDLMAIIKAGPSLFEPNSKAQYSNSNYILLTYILEDVYKKSYSSLLEAFITKPLQLEHTALGNQINLKNNDCYSYEKKKKWKKSLVTDMSVPLGAGAIVSTPKDLNVFVEALFQEQLVSQESLQKMISIEDGYGRGIFPYPFFDKTCYGHTGGIDGFRSHMVHFKEDNLSVSITSNGTDYSVNELMLGAVSSFYNKPFAVPVFKNIQLKSKQLDQYLGKYTSDELPLEVVITKEGNVLVGQATGQSSFELQPIDEHVFKFSAAGLELRFNPEKNEMLLLQGGAKFLFKK